MSLADACRHLAARAEHRRFGRAAAACRITQPALSDALRKLKRELGSTASSPLSAPNRRLVASASARPRQAVRSTPLPWPTRRDAIRRRWSPLPQARGCCAATC
jgi:hypothetical protein